MKEPVFYIRGFPETFSPENPPAKDELIRDLKTINSLSDEDITKLHNNLKEVKGFLDPKALLVILQGVVKRSEIAAALRRILRNIGPSQVDRVIKILEDDLKQENPSFNQDETQRLKQILKKLIRAYPALAKFQKAKRLAEITGQQLETVELICDLRPIFDESRKNIEGMMPYTRLHLVATGEDGLPNAFEVELTHQQVINLAEKAGKAKNKLEALRMSIKKWVPGGLPDLPLTRISQKESKDV